MAGNRTSVTVNGVTTESRTYDAANQVSNTGWLYDAAGNLLTDGSAVYTYDAFSRPLTVVAGLQARANTYNGDGVLVSQISNSLLTRYTQDLAAPLSQILQTSQLAGVTTNYLYGMDRLASVTAGVRTWQVGDALGSVRQTRSDVGVSLVTPTPAYYSATTSSGSLTL